MTDNHPPAPHGLKATLREYVTHWTIAGSIVAFTGLSPDHWIGHVLQVVPEGVRHVFPQGIDYRLVVVGLGVLMIVADILYRSRQRAKLLALQAARSTAMGGDASNAAHGIAGSASPVRGSLAARRSNRRLPDTMRSTEVEAPEPSAVPQVQIVTSKLRHDLRTPMNAILGYGEVLIAEAAELGIAEHLPELIQFHDDAKRMLERINGALPSSGTDSSVDAGTIRARVRAQLLEPARSLQAVAGALLGQAGHIEAAHSDLDRAHVAACKLAVLVEQLDTRADAAIEEGGAASVERALSRLQPMASQGTSDGTVLVVDDNVMNRDLLSRQLVREGYNVMTASSGREALETMRLNNFDLVLLDVVMPEMDGVQVLEQIEHDTSLAEVPVIMLSALDEMAGAVRCLENGAADYLTKPVDPLLLRARVQSALQLRRLRYDLRHLERELEDSSGAMDRMARSIAPPSIAPNLARGELPSCVQYPEVTAVVVRIEGIDAIATRRPGDVPRLLGAAIAALEKVASDRKLDLTRATDRAFVVIAGATVWNPLHAETAADLALELRKAFQGVMADATEPFHARIGLHTGTLMTGVAGTDTLVLGLWGDAVSTAEAIAAHAPLGTICASNAAFAQWGTRFTSEDPLSLDIPGRGRIPVRRIVGSSAQK